jgi:hypothetical protein
MQGSGQSELGEDGNRLDSYVERASRGLAQGTSRHGFLGKVCKGLLGAVGAGLLLPTLPFDRRIQLTSATQDCTYWTFCDLDGWPCQWCGTSGGCPSGCTQSTLYWVGCCWAPPNGQGQVCPYYVRYNDCCGANCNPSCSGTACTNSNEPSYCSDNTYGCTVVTASTTKCGNCLTRPNSRGTRKSASESAMVHVT